MRFYLETAHFSEAQRATALGFLAGVYVPRRIVQATGRDYLSLVSEISGLSLPWLGVEVEALDSVGIELEIASLHDVAKDSSCHTFAPLTLQTLQALSRETTHGKAFGVQYPCSLTQVLLAARAGATEAILDAQVLAAAGIDPSVLLTQFKRVFLAYEIPFTFLVSGIRDSLEIERLALAGTDGVICSWEIVRGLAYHPYTDLSIQRVLELRSNKPT